MIYPSLNNGHKNYRFNRFVDPDNDLVQMKSEWLEQNIKEEHLFIKNISSSFFEERKCNPFLRLHEDRFKEVFDEKNPVQLLDLMLRLRNEYWKQEGL